MKYKITIAISLIGLLLGGIAYWFQPYNQQDLFGVSIYLIMGVGAFLSSFFIKIYLKEKPLKIANFVSLGVIMAVLARIIFDVAFWDSTSHNLAPFEIIICGLNAFFPALIGGFLGKLVLSLFMSNTILSHKKESR
ncbi:hypothetical protein [Belliella aquatica]|uniref:Uncharacterized protein n=1 Tax=Belliella aquatica TaxID=1323734 RepID=A0ABQ1M8E1_9BACT|nr:hypothetical protein [Belliella aquatica]MCH7405614.1 hypothetical protein [Belliella aquatica]GGC36397.1 hypothetical protein GCM10010993_14060 [Belliella aquatica]